jgi:hypothetical protein
MRTGFHRAAASVAALGLCAAFALPARAQASAPRTVVFDEVGTVHRFTVPPDVTVIDVVACGGGGAEQYPAGFSAGGQANAALAVTPGEVLTVRVGGAGSAESGGFNGGGDSINGFGGGGGASDVRQGGDGLGDRVVIAGGGGGGGVLVEGGIGFIGLRGGIGGGLTGGHGVTSSGGRGGTSTAGGAGGPDLTATAPASNGEAGSLGRGGDSPWGGAGGGGLYGGGGGGIGEFPAAQSIHAASGGGGSGLGDSFGVGTCVGDGTVRFGFDSETAASILPSGVGVWVEGDSGSSTWNVPVYLSEPLTEEVTVEWTTATLAGVGLVESGVDVLHATGTVTFAPGQTVANVPIEVLGDTADEPPLLWGEWGVVLFSSPSPNAYIDTSGFFGAGLMIIIDDD